MGTERERSRFLENAERNVKRGKLQEAIQEYKKVLAVDPQDVHVRNIVSDLYLKANQKDRAIEEMYKIASHYEERGSYSQSMAVYKKIIKLNPGNIESSMKLADLYYAQGFLSEAKSEYSKIAKGLVNSKRMKEAIFLYEKLQKLDRKDIQTKIFLADLYAREGEIDKAVERYNDAAESKIRTSAFKDAHEVLKRAKDLKEDHSRTVANMVKLLQKEDKKKDARKLIDNILKKNKDDVNALRLLGNLHFEEKDFERAELVFAQVISLKPKDVEARVKLGRISISKDELDKAFELYEPLVETLVKKQKFEKAVGLLGLILSAKKVHIPTLQALASLYQSTSQKKNLEIVYRVLLEEYRKENRSKEYLSTLGELVSLCPEDKQLESHFNQLKGGAEGPVAGVEERPAEEEVRRAAEEERKRAEEEAKKTEEERLRVEEERKKAEEEQRRAEEGARRAEEERKKAEEEARKAVEEEARTTAEEEARRKIEEEARKTEEQARRAEEEARRAEESARKAAEEEAKRKVEEEARRRAEEEARRAEDEKKRAEEDRRRAEEEVRKAEEQRRRAEDARKAAEEAARKAEEMRVRLEEEARRADEDKRRAEEEARRAEEEKRQAEEERARSEEEAKRTAEEEARKTAEEEARRATEEESRRKADEEAQKAGEEERKKMEEALKAERITKVSTEEIKELEEIIEEKKEVEPSEPEEGSKELLEMNLAQADLYINQGLLRNAKRILENLRIQFPNDPRLEEKLTALGDVSKQVSVDEILQRVTQVSEQESELLTGKESSDAGAQQKAMEVPKEETREEEKEVVKEKETVEAKGEKEEEIAVQPPDQGPVEKMEKEDEAREKETPLKKEEPAKEEKKGDDYAGLFHSGISLLEEGSINQAIEKFKQASKDESLSEECYHSLSQCYRQKEDYSEAAKWLKKAQELTQEGTDQYLALSYELAALYEDADEEEKALDLFEEIKEYDAKYRDVKKKIKTLKKSLK